jgi:hypothetical protein
VRNDLNEAYGKGRIQFELFRQGFPDLPKQHGELYPEKVLLAMMDAYPNGTQFAVFVYGESEENKPGAQHWLYAARYKGSIFFEDFQKNLKASGPTTSNKSAPVEALPAIRYLGRFPNHPVTLQPGFFKQGMFYALAPITWKEGEDKKARLWKLQAALVGSAKIAKAKMLAKNLGSVENYTPQPPLK